MPSAICFKLVEDSSLGFPALLSEPAKVSFPIRLALGRLREVADHSAVAAQLKRFATFDRIESNRSWLSAIQARYDTFPGLGLSPLSSNLLSDCQNLKVQLCSADECAQQMRLSLQTLQFSCDRPPQLG